MLILFEWFFLFENVFQCYIKVKITLSAFLYFRLFINEKALTIGNQDLLQFV
jgi:hypothetical protein